MIFIGKCVTGFGIIVSNLVLIMFCFEILIVVVFCVVFDSWCGWYVLLSLDVDIVLFVVEIIGIFDR